MPHRGRLVAVMVLLVIVIATAYEVLYMDISALPEPGRVESTVASRAKDWYIRRAARHSVSLPPQSSAAMIGTGETSLEWAAPTVTVRTGASLHPSANPCIPGCSI